MSHLSWISDDKLCSAVDTLVERCTKARDEAETKILKNVVDPFSCLTVASTFNIKTQVKLLKLQKNASILSGIASAIGNFHQNILSSVDGWVNHDAGYDIKNDSKRMLAEIKNKHNTLNATNRQQVIDDLDTTVKQERGDWTAYLVLIIPKEPKRYKVREKGKSRKIYEIDGASFYTMITGEPDAIHDLFSVTSAVLQKKSGIDFSKEIKSYCTHILEQSIPE